MTTKGDPKEHAPPLYICGRCGYNTDDKAENYCPSGHEIDEVIV